MMTVSSVNVGHVETRANASGKQKRSAIGKRPVTHPVAVGKSGLDGDESAYRSRALGDTAVHVFCMDSYRKLSAQAGFDLPVPCFGENLTIDGLEESDVRVGDIYRAGGTTLRVNQPVVRCTWPGVIAGEPKLLKWILKLNLTGFFLDVVEPGQVRAGDGFVRIEQGPDADLTITALNRALANDADLTLDERILADAILAERWKKDFRRSRGVPSSPQSP